MSKQYGLIIPNKSKLTLAHTIKRPSIFDEESTSEEDVEKPTGLPTAIKRQDKIAREKAVEEDPTVYQYDEIFDQIEQKRKDSKLSRKEIDKKPKYIIKLLDAADKRKRENERRIERQVQKEREAEGDEFKDKESFVTSAYKKKLEELKKQEEEEKREEYLEAIGDVRKQGNLDGFYRHLYDQKINYSDRIKLEEEIKEEADSKTSPKPKVTTSPDSSDENISRTPPPLPVSKKHDPQKRTYRKRKSSESDGKEESVDEKKLEHLPSNLDADSDFSIDSDTDDSGDESKPKKIKVEAKAVEPKVEDTILKKIGGDNNENKIEEEKKEIKQEPEAAEEVKPKKPKIDIWKKRTVGVVFDEALQRYFERKALREAGK